MHAPLTDYETNILIADGKAHLKSKGTLRMFGYLDRPWSLIAAFQILPAPMLDWAYSMLARNRLRLFGKSEACFIPSPEIRERFLS